MAQFLFMETFSHGCSIKIYTMILSVWHGPIIEALLWTKKNWCFLSKKWHFHKNRQNWTQFCNKVHDYAELPYKVRKALKFRTFFVLV